MIEKLIALQLFLSTKRDEKGATAVEYGLMVALIAVAIIVTVTTLGGNLSDLFGDIGNTIGGVGGGGGGA